MSLIVRNLRYTTSPERIRKYFDRFGEVKDVYLPLDYYTKLPRGFGFVEFARDEDAEAALQATSRNIVIDGSDVSVTVAQQGRKSPETMRHKERARYRRSYSNDRRRSYRSPPIYRRSRSRSYGPRRRGSRRSNSSPYYHYEDEDNRSMYRSTGERYRSPPRYYRERRKEYRRSSSIEMPRKYSVEDIGRGRRSRRHPHSVSSRQCSPVKSSKRCASTSQNNSPVKKQTESPTYRSKNVSPASDKCSIEKEKNVTKSRSRSASYIERIIHEDVSVK